jgi:regulator of sigma E protease
MTLVISILAILLTILLVVSVHEYGHFIFARLVGVKVLRFSIGFGKPFFHWYDKKGTEYALAPIPLGGYVKLLDENEGAVPADQLPFAYNRQPMYKRFLIAFAGPLFNIIFALILYWILFVTGFTTIVPITGDIAPHSIAYNAGMKSHEEIISINHAPTNNWMSITIRILMAAGDKGTMLVGVKEPHSGKIRVLSLQLANWHLDDLKPDPLQSLGISSYQLLIPAVIHTISEDSPALHKLMPGDKIISADSHPIKDWYDLVSVILSHPEQTLPFTLVRHGKVIHTTFTVGYKRNIFFHKQGFLGVAPEFVMPKELLRTEKYSLIEAVNHAWNEMYELTQLNFIIIGKMLTGKISIKSLGGPITIFEGAGTALNAGIAPFLGFLAFLSIAVGIINILPIPTLDGGHVLLQVIELIIRRPLSLRLQALFYRLGFIFIVLLLIQTLVNDFLRI